MEDVAAEMGAALEAEQRHAAQRLDDQARRAAEELAAAKFAAEASRDEYIGRYRVQYKQK
jgi:hypothetical protein